MIVEKIESSTESYRVQKTPYDRTWYLVREADSDFPWVISIRNGGYGPNSHVYLPLTSPLRAKVLRAVKQATSTEVADAVKAWHEVSWKYSDFGASDTEPRAEFAYLFERAVEGKKVALPRSIRDWQIFDTDLMDGRKGSGEAARELTKAAKKVVEAVKRNPEEARKVFEYEYGYVPFGAEKEELMPQPKKGVTFTHKHFLAPGTHNRTIKATMRITAVRKDRVYYTYNTDPKNSSAFYMPRDEWVEKYGDE